MIKFKVKSDQLNSNIDESKRVIHNVIIAEIGEAAGHGVYVEKSFLESLVEYANNEMDNVPCNFDHPKNWSGTHELGSQAGYICNVTLKDDKVFGDLHLYESANDSPLFPKMVDYIIAQAKEDKYSISLSIGFTQDGYFQIDPETKERTEVFKNIDDAPIEGENIYIIFGKLHFCDLVTNGAITSSLFSTPTKVETMNVDELNFQVNSFREKLKTQDELLLKKNQDYIELLNEFEQYKIETTQVIKRLESLPSDEHTPDTPDPRGDDNEDFRKERKFMSDPIHRRAMKIYNSYDRK